MTPGETHAVINSHETVTGDFTRNPDFHFPGRRLHELITQASGGRADFLEATRIATALMGDSIATNLFMLGYAWQKGLVPLSGDAILQAIEVNAVAVEANKRAFLWGRRAAHDLEAVQKAAAPKAEPESHHLSETLDQVIERRQRFLTDYQNAAYAERYLALVEKARNAESTRTPGLAGFADAVARYGFKLMAYKDEYEVARLFTDGNFEAKLRETFEGDFKLHFHLAPPIVAEKKLETGHLKKKEYGPWMFTAFKLLAKLRGLRGTPFDVFGHSAERRTERQLIRDYTALIDEVAARLDHENHALAVALASVPEKIRGYGHVKEAHLADAKAQEAELLGAFRNPQAAKSAAE